MHGPIVRLDDDTPQLTLLKGSSLESRLLQTKQGLTLNGSITGVEDGSKVELSQYTASGMQKDTAIIKDGKFIIKGDFPNPTLCYFAIADTRAYAQIYVVNGSMTLTGPILPLVLSNIASLLPL